LANERTNEYTAALLCVHTNKIKSNKESNKKKRREKEEAEKRPVCHTHTHTTLKEEEEEESLQISGLSQLLVRTTTISF
jgi:hypothetical protein